MDGFPEYGVRTGGISDPWFFHFLRFLPLLAISYLTAGGLLVGLAFVLQRTGYRVRDLLLMLIPIYNVALLISVIWRFTAKTVYWTPRYDLPSSTLFGPPGGSSGGRPRTDRRPPSTASAVTFGTGSVDDRAIRSGLLERARGRPYVLLEEAKDSTDPAEAPDHWPTVRGNRVVFMSDESGRFPVAVVVSEQIQDSVLSDVFQDWMAPFEERKVRPFRWLAQRPQSRMVMLVVGVVGLLLAGDVWAYFGEARALGHYTKTIRTLTGSPVAPGVAGDPAATTRALDQLRSHQRAVQTAAEEFDAARAVYVAPVLPWHRTHRLAKATLVEMSELRLRYSQMQAETWRLAAEAYKNPQRRCVRTAFSFFFPYERYCAEYGLFPDSALEQAALANQQKAKALDVRREVLVRRFEMLMGVDIEPDRVDTPAA